MNNIFKTTLYLGLLTGLILTAGQLLGGANGLMIAFAIAMLTNFVSYYFSDKIVLSLYRAKEVSENEEPKLHRIVEELSKKANIPKPRVYFLNMNVMNAFATGRSPKHSAIAVTRMLLDSLNEDEIKAVLGHELSHVKNRDTLISTVSATLAGTITMLTRLAWYSGMFVSKDRDNSAGEAISMMLLLILTPILALIIRLAISRTREFSADNGGAQLSTPKAMISALEKLEFGPKLRGKGTSATAHLFITNPFKDNDLTNLFSTHPSIVKRVERIREEFNV